MSPSSPWSWNTIGCRPDCCDKDNNCRYYVPCCLRDIRVQISQFTEIPGGDLAGVTVKRMTLTNNCNNQESVDWSWFNNLDSTITNSEISTSFSGRSCQGCTFGLDIEPEHLFCVCNVDENGDPLPNFTAKVTVCNSSGEAVATELRQPSLAISYDCFNFCGFSVMSSDTGPVSLDVGEEYEFTLKFGISQPCQSLCFTTTKQVMAIPITATGFLNSLKNYIDIDTICVKYLECLKNSPAEIPEDWIERDACDDITPPAPCPPCDCILDYNKIGDFCGCSCGGQIPLNACDPPKQTCSGCTSTSGSVQICHESYLSPGDSTIDSGGPEFIECWNGCVRTAAIRFPSSGTSLWEYIRYGTLAPLGLPAEHRVSLTYSGYPSCECYSISWDWDGVDQEITVNGNTQTTPIDPDFTPYSGGTCYILAKGGAVFSVGCTPASTFTASSVGLSSPSSSASSLGMFDAAELFYGSSSIQSSSSTVSASGTFVPWFRATGSLQQDSSILSASGTYEGPFVGTGTGSLQSAPHTVSGSGTFTAPIPVFTGQGILNQNATLLSATGAYYPLLTGQGSLVSLSSLMSGTGLFYTGGVPDACYCSSYVPLRGRIDWEDDGTWDISHAFSIGGGTFCSDRERFSSSPGVGIDLAFWITPIESIIQMGRSYPDPPDELTLPAGWKAIVYYIYVNTSLGVTLYHYWYTLLQNPPPASPVNCNTAISWPLDLQYLGKILRSDSPSASDPFPGLGPGSVARLELI